MKVPSSRQEPRIHPPTLQAHLESLVPSADFPAGEEDSYLGTDSSPWARTAPALSRSPCPGLSGYVPRDGAPEVRRIRGNGQGTEAPFPFRPREGPPTRIQKPANSEKEFLLNDAGSSSGLYTPNTSLTYFQGKLTFYVFVPRNSDL